MQVAATYKLITRWRAEHILSWLGQLYGAQKLDFKNIYIYLIYFNWGIISLHYCDGFCHTSTRTSHGYTCVSPLLNPPPTSFLTLSSGLSHKLASGALFQASNLHWSYILLSKFSYFFWLTPVIRVWAAESSQNSRNSDHVRKKYNVETSIDRCIYCPWRWV